MEEQLKNDQNRTIKYLDRGMTVDEVNKLLTAPMPDRERSFFRAIYDTFYRANELLMCNIENYNKDTGELVALHTKNKYNPKTKQYIKSPPKQALLSKPTRLLFKSIIGNRKKGPIFINKKGNRLSITHFQVFINKIATKIGIQQVVIVTNYGKKRQRRPQNLVTLKALREAGERHMDLHGADRDVTARGSQHSALVKEKHYKKSGWEEFQQQQKKFHPAFKEEYNE